MVESAELKVQAAVAGVGRGHQGNEGDREAQRKTGRTPSEKKPKKKRTRNRKKWLRGMYQQRKSNHKINPQQPQTQTTGTSTPKEKKAQKGRAKASKKKFESLLEEKCRAQRKIHY